MNTAARRPRWPRTLSARLLLVLLGGLSLAHALSFGLLFFERNQSTRSMMLRNLDEDVAVSVALLEHLPAEQREAWVPRLERRTYRYLLRPAAAGPGLQTDRARRSRRSSTTACGTAIRCRRAGGSPAGAVRGGTAPARRHTLDH